MDKVEILAYLKLCFACKEWKDASNYWVQSSSKDGLQTYCKKCHYRKNKSKRHLYKETDKAYKDKYKSRGKDLSLQNTYGITLEEYLSIKEKQDNACAICHTKESLLRKSLAVDHNHSTGKIRGLLCSRCNRGLGFFQDNSSLLNKARIYLDEHDG
jgi:hypothetical protein